MNIKKMLGFLICLIATHTYADPVTVNNSNSSGQGVVAPPCPPANQNNIYDPRVPPAGVYQSQSGTLYTTGEKKPYLTDNGCNTSTNAAQPYVNVGPGPGPEPRPGPRDR